MATIMTLCWQEGWATESTSRAQELLKTATLPNGSICVHNYTKRIGKWLVWVWTLLGTLFQLGTQSLANAYLDMTPNYETGVRPFVELGRGAEERSPEGHTLAPIAWQRSFLKHAAILLHPSLPGVKTFSTLCASSGPCPGDGRPVYSDLAGIWSTPHPFLSPGSHVLFLLLGIFFPHFLLVSSFKSQLWPSQTAPNWLRHPSSTYFFQETCLGILNGYTPKDLCFPTGALCPKDHNCLLNHLSC